jgi:hypothetical protein
VRLLAALLAEGGALLSARRAGMVAGNVAAVHAARLSADAAARRGGLGLDRRAQLHALRGSRRQLEDAEARSPATARAWRQAAARAEDPMTRILAERDPVARVKLALAATGLPDGELTTIVTDALASCPDGRRHALAEWLFGGDARDGAGAEPRLELAKAAPCRGCSVVAAERRRRDGARAAVRAGDPRAGAAQRAAPPHVEAPAAAARRSLPAPAARPSQARATCWPRSSQRQAPGARPTWTLVLERMPLVRQAGALRVSDRGNDGQGVA